jgi:hypothetical protein
MSPLPVFYHDRRGRRQEATSIRRVADAGGGHVWQGRVYSCPLSLGENPCRSLTPRTPDILAPWDHGL